MNELGDKGKLAFIGALGAGCILGASGLILIQRLSHKVESTAPLASTNAILRRELMTIQDQIQEMNMSINELKLRYPPRKKPIKSALRTVTFSDESFEKDPPSSSSSCLGDPFFSHQSQEPSSSYYSAVPTTSSDEEEDDQEFFDVEVDSLASTDVSESNKRILELFNKVDDLLEGQSGEQKLAYILLKENEVEYYNNSEFLWRLCKSVYMMAVIAGVEGDSDKRKELIFQSAEAGKKSLEINDQSAEAHKWFAIVIGTKGEYLGLKEKILDGYKFKEHIDRAGDLAPLDHSIQHLLGRFCFEVAELSWFERKMASTLFADPPTSSIEEALEHFMKAEELKSDGWKENRLFLAKCQIKMQNYALAIVWLDSTLALPIISNDDQQVHDEARGLLLEYERYREG